MFLGMGDAVWGQKATSMSSDGGGRLSARQQQRKSAKLRLTAGKASLPHATRRPGFPVGVCLADRRSGSEGRDEIRRVRWQN